MESPFASAIAAAAAASPMAAGSLPVVPGRILLVDGDGLAYYCAGKDDSDAGEARRNLVSKIKNAAELVSAERVVVLLTASGSVKGMRYAIARVKPYQGQRANSRRPTNWRALRDYMEGTSFPYEVNASLTAEADDLFGWYAYNWPDKVVIYTQDKDMRMLPGTHLDWVSHRTHRVQHSFSLHRERELMYNIRALDSVFNEKQYGPKWFWLQMLHGDTADNIPGLPKYVVDGKAKPVGEVTANKLLDTGENLAGNNHHIIVKEWYKSYYGERWLVEMMEQACLLWMRRVPEHWDDCLNPGGPMAHWNDGEHEFAKAYFEIESRVRQAEVLNAAAESQ